MFKCLGCKLFNGVGHCAELREKFHHDCVDEFEPCDVNHEGSTLLNTASSFWLQGTSEKRRWGETPQIRFAHSPPANIHSVAVQLQPHSRAHLKSEIQLARSAFKLAFSRDSNHHNAISHPAFWLSGNAGSIRQALGWPDLHGWGPGLQQ